MYQHGSIRQPLVIYLLQGWISALYQCRRRPKTTLAISCKYSRDGQVKGVDKVCSHIHGGYNPIKSIMYDDVYALAVPSFTWTRLYNGSSPISGHTCHTAGKRQFARFGGSRDASMYAVETTGQIPNLTSLRCDANSGVSLFDMTNLIWGTYFDYYAPEYQLPQKIVDVIGGT